MIPKIIHYCWFGGDELSKEAKECIASWKAFFPDYKIIEWNESNVDINECEYAKQAYECKKWAFVSDYFRFKILYDIGGVYFDTDVRVLKAMDSILDKGSYFGRETQRDGGTINPGLGMAIEPHHSLYREMLESYQNDKFIYLDGTMNLTTVGQRLTNILEKHGYAIEKDDNKIKCIDGISIYPEAYFCPMGYNGMVNITSNSYSIHLYTASWLSKYDQNILRYNMKKNQANAIERIWWRMQLRFTKLRRKYEC